MPSLNKTVSKQKTATLSHKKIVDSKRPALARDDLQPAHGGRENKGPAGNTKGRNQGGSKVRLRQSNKR